MTRATRNRVEQRLKRKGEAAPHEAGFRRGWTAGRTQLANALSSPEGFKTTDGNVFRLERVGKRAMTLADIDSDVHGPSLVDGEGWL